MINFDLKITKLKFFRLSNMLNLFLNFDKLSYVLNYYIESKHLKTISQFSQFDLENFIANK